VCSVRGVRGKTCKSAEVAANVGTLGTEALAIADQTALISQQLNDVTAHATVEQDAEIDQ